MCTQECQRRMYVPVPAFRSDGVRAARLETVRKRRTTGSSSRDERAVRVWRASVCAGWSQNQPTAGSCNTTQRSSSLMLALFIPFCCFSAENRFDMASHTHTHARSHKDTYTVHTPTHKHTYTPLRQIISVFQREYKSLSLYGLYKKSQPHRNNLHLHRSWLVFLVPVTSSDWSSRI